MIRRDRRYEFEEDPEVLDWWALTPAERFQAFARLWPTYLSLG